MRWPLFLATPFGCPRGDKCGQPRLKISLMPASRQVHKLQFEPVMAPQTQTQTPDVSDDQPAPRHTGLCCRQCMKPVATLRGTGRSSLVASCPSCGFIWIIGAPVAIEFAVARRD